MKKIIIEKEEGIAEVVDRMLEEEDAELTLVIPKGSALGRSVKNFHLLKREADAAGKDVAVESVDETILAFAKGSDLEGIHPLWHGVHGTGGFSDIVPVTPGEGDEAEGARPKHISRRRGKKKVEPVKLTVHSELEEPQASGEFTETEAEEKMEVEDEEIQEKEDHFFGVGRFFKKNVFQKDTSNEDREEEADNNDEDDSSDTRPQKRRIPRRLAWIAGGVLAAILLVVWIMSHFFGHAAIAVDFKKTPWSYQGTFLADKSVSKASVAASVIPAQVFTAQKNTTQSFPASGKANVSEKARGTITIYNAYSSAAQQLVATTRFVTPDGKLFRLVNAVTVPGAQVTNGQIVPSSIDTPIIADQAGPTYNIGAVAKLTIPGFQGSPKYDAFYGAIAGGTDGGFIGNKAVPTAADITTAKAKTTATLQASLASSLTTSYPNNFKILDGATTVVVTKLTVSSSTDSNGNFIVFGEATLQAIGFDETAFKTLLLSMAQSQKQNSTFSVLTLDYNSPKPDFTKGKLSFSISAEGSLEPIFSADDFKNGIVGKGINEARSAIAALPDLADGKISVWPMWLWSMPSNSSKIEVTAN